MRTEVKSTCCYCGVGCGVLIETEDGVVTGLRPISGKAPGAWPGWAATQLGAGFG